MYVYGKNVFKELINNNKRINKVILHDNFDDKEMFLEIKNRNIKIEYVSKKEIDKLVLGNHQGIIADIDDYQYRELNELLNSINKEYPLILILDHIQDPHNFGAIIRSAESVVVDGIIIPKDRGTEVNSTVMKTSAGALEYVPISMVTNLVGAINELKNRGYWIVGADMNGKNYSEIDYQMPIGLVIGSEGNGLSRLVKEKCDHIISIPMRGKINSLNASVATGIILYEIIKKRLK